MPQELTEKKVGGRKRYELGKRYGMMVVLEKKGIDPRSKHSLFMLRCDCGSVKEMILSNLKNGGTVSCGCFQRKTAGDHTLKHGQGRKVGRTPEYLAWKNMKARCGDKNRPDYGFYGGRGIQVCEEWGESFAAFFKSVGMRPTSEHSLDRINNDLGYGPGNVRWATKKEQANNRRERRRKVIV